MKESTRNEMTSYLPIWKSGSKINLVFLPEFRAPFRVVAQFQFLYYPSMVELEDCLKI